MQSRSENEGRRHRASGALSNDNAIRGRPICDIGCGTGRFVAVLDWKTYQCPFARFACNTYAVVPSTSFGKQVVSMLREAGF